MEIKKQVLKLGVGLLLYVLDIVTDIYVLTKYYQEGETVWFSLTLACLVISSVIVNITAFRNRGEELGRCVYIAASVGQMCVIVRYVEQFIILKRGYTNTDAAMHKLDQVRYTEALSESAPQWCIQTYVMLRLWSFPWYAIASTIVSLLSVIWGFVSVRMSYIKIEGEDEHIRHPFVLAIALFVSQLGFLISRLSLLAILAFDLTEYDLTERKLKYAVGSVFMLRLLILLSCGIILVMRLFITIEIDQIWLLTKIIFISFFDVTISQGHFGKRIVNFACLLYFLESLVGLTSIWCISATSDFAGMEFIKYIGPVSVLGGVGIGILFFGIYYKGRYDYVLCSLPADREVESASPMAGYADSNGSVRLDINNILVQETRRRLSYGNRAFTGSCGDSITQHGVHYHGGYPPPQDDQRAWHMSYENHAISYTSENHPQARQDSDSNFHSTLSPVSTEPCPAVSPSTDEETGSISWLRAIDSLFG